VLATLAVGFSVILMLLQTKVQRDLVNHEREKVAARRVHPS
jgi:hypothetical protein